MPEIRQLLGSSAFSDLDRHFAAFIEEQAGGEQPLVALAAALVSRKRSEGHICLSLETLAGSTLPEMPADGVTPIQLPRLKEWTRALRASPVVGSRGRVQTADPGCPSSALPPPLLGIRANTGCGDPQARGQRAAATRLAGAQPEAPGSLSPTPGEPVNWQREAALAAVRQGFCVISGGPGTGKTHTLVLILALLLELEPHRKLRIAVAAPTGKAAARIQDSIRTVKATLGCDETIKAQLPERASTIHRLLGYLPDSARFRHDADNPVPYDVVAVDEASMVDLALMTKLFRAIPVSARVILLGDKDQLASVEAGAVLGDICAAAVTGSSEGRGVGCAADGPTLTPSFSPSDEERVPVRPGEGSARGSLADCVVQLRKNYRFGEQSAIYRLSNAINEGRAEDALQVLKGAGANAAADLISTPLPRRSELKEAMRARVTTGFSEFLKASDPVAALAALARFRILCALREGPFGVAGLNQVTEEILEEAGLIRPQNPWYARRPIMITRNDYNLKLFNGDIGLLLPDADSGEPRAFFPGPDNALRKFLPLRLPEHETAYAMTVHKSQGSEFDRVLLILPDRESPVLSRELLYTGITRARTRVELWFDEKIFRAALARRVTRTSGLCDALH